jgi:predicted phosphate transport protein (TIGR00153 family)
MANLTNLFGESPFAALKAHASRVHQSVGLLRELFQKLEEADREGLVVVAEKVFALETEADAIRNRVHEMLTSKALMPMRKDDLFNILEQQDSMADRAEDIAAALTYRDMRLPAESMAEIRDYLDHILKNCELAAGIMSKLDLLVEASFSGRDALTVSKLITELAEREDATKALQIAMTRRFLAAENTVPPVETVLWLQVIGFIADLSKYADRTGNGIRMTLKIKS